MTHPVAALAALTAIHELGVALLSSANSGFSAA